MTEAGESFPKVDRMVHEPSRLAILTVLSACSSADFVFLQAATGLTKGNLFVQLTRLEEAGLVHVEKTVHCNKPRTKVELSTWGKRQLSDYWRTMKKIQAQAEIQPG